jgi:N-sulfoglucosamine sulfohydrolase
MNPTFDRKRAARRLLIALLPLLFVRGEITRTALTARSHALKPNILLILADDAGPHLGCYGTPLVHTPHLDRLAAEGVRFMHAFTTAPICSPSRSSLVTGMYQTSIGAHNHRAVEKRPLPAGVKLLTDYFRGAGYFTVNSPGPAGEKFGKTDFNFLAEHPFDGYDWRQCAAGQPFFAQMTLMESHRGPGWKEARRRRKLVDPHKVKLPPYYPDHPTARDEYANYLDAISLMDEVVGATLKRLKDEGLAENTVVVFMGDNGACLFRDKQFLYDGGLHVPLIVRYPDRRQAGKVRDDLISGVDLAPTLLALAGIKAPAHMQGHNFLAANHQPREHVFAARDRADISFERMRAVRTRRYNYIRNFLPGLPYMQPNPYKEREYPTWNLVKQLKAAGRLNAAQSLFAADSKPVEELYDLAADPHEVHNLASDPAHAATLDELRRALDEWIVNTKDQGATFEDPLPVYRSYFGKKR